MMATNIFDFGVTPDGIVQMHGRPSSDKKNLPNAMIGKIFKNVVS
jgi:hypothetical protein